MREVREQNREESEGSGRMKAGIKHKNKRYKYLCNSLKRKHRYILLKTID